MPQAGHQSSEGGSGCGTGAGAGSVSSGSVSWGAVSDGVAEFSVILIVGAGVIAALALTARPSPLVPINISFKIEGEIFMLPSTAHPKK